MRTFFEFFAGGGMARIGLGAGWQCTFANDISPQKAASYFRNFPDAKKVFRLRDIKRVTTRNLPDVPDLIWGSFPCQDLSLAGAGSGLAGARSGLIWKLLELTAQLKVQNRAPKVLVLENVPGLLNSRGGRDLQDILLNIQAMGYVVGVLSIDAVKFLPHSRQRLFIVAADAANMDCSSLLLRDRTDTSPYEWTTPRLDAVWASADSKTRKNWVWWNLPSPLGMTTSIADVIERDYISWDTDIYTGRLLDLMSPTNIEKISRARRIGREVIGCAYRRTRVEGTERVQRVEVRFDGLSGCIRTATGGSSRQRLLFVNGDSVRSRLMSPREAVRLMGLPEWYDLPSRYNEAYQLAGDGVAIPVVQWLSQHLLTPLVDSSDKANSDSLSSSQVLLYA